MKYSIKTPARKKQVKRLTRRSYASFAASIVNCDATCSKVLLQLSRKVKEEMKNFSTDEFGSTLQDMYAAVNQFSWETEMRKGLPTLTNFLSLILPRPKLHTPLMCMIASQLLKARHQRMNLVQRAVSTLLYGNGTNKQVKVYIGILLLLPIFCYYYYHRCMAAYKSSTSACHIEQQCQPSTSCVKTMMVMHIAG